MVKYYCDRCIKKVKETELLDIIVWVEDNRSECQVCKECAKKFRKLLKEFKS